MPELRGLDTAVLLIYVVGIVAFGSWFAKRNKTADDFMTAGRSLPGWVVGLSVFGTYLSSNTFLGWTGQAYGADWNRFVFSLSLPIAVLIAVRWFVPFFRQSGEISAYHHLEHRFGPWARTYAVICQLLTQFARVGSIMYGVGLALEALLGWDIWAIIIVTGCLVTLYTVLGGIAAVIWTDVVQAIILSVGALVALCLLLLDTPGGPSEIFRVASEYDKFSLGDFELSLYQKNPPTHQELRVVWVVLVYGFFINLANFGVDQNFVQRYHVAKSEREAAKSLWLGALTFVPASLLFCFIGTALFSYYESQPALKSELLQKVQRQAEQTLEKKDVSPSSPGYDEVLAAEVKRLTNDRAFPHFIVTQLPAGLAGLLIAALFAAAMSSVDSSLNSSVTVFTSDIYKRYFRPSLDDTGTLRVLHISTVVFGIVGTGVGLALINVKSVLDEWWKLQGVFAGGMLGLFLLGLISRRANNAGAVTGVVAGVVLIAWMALPGYFPESLKSPFHSFMTIVFGTLTIFVVGIVVSGIGKPRS